MNSRLELHEVLCGIIDNNHVYFQPPEGLKMLYPAIRYQRDDIENFYANDSVYIKKHKYQIIVIDKDPDSEIVEKIAELPTASFSRHYYADGYNHDVFTLFY